MRKIKSKYEQAKKQQRNNLILGIILIFVMFGSVFGIVVDSFGNKNSDSILEYQGYEFLAQDGLFYTSKDNFNFVFNYFPNESINIYGIVKPLSNYQNKPLYIYSEDDDSTAIIYQNLNPFIERIQSACLSKEKCKGDYPVKTCSDNFIIIEQGKEKITQKDNCVYIRGEKEELLKLSNEFLFKSIGIK